jgi:GTP-binding protein LepA
LKTVSKGYASFDYAPIGMRTSNLVKVDILLNATVVDALSLLIHVDNAYHIGKKCVKTKELFPVSSLIFQFKLKFKVLQFVEVKMRYGGDISKRKMKTEKRKKTAS